MVPASPDHALAARGPLRPFTPHQEQEMCCCSFSPQTVSMREPEIVLLFFLSANGTNARAGNCVVILSLRKRDKCESRAPSACKWPLRPSAGWPSAVKTEELVGVWARPQQ